jgi:hypothetical protein
MEKDVIQLRIGLCHAESWTQESLCDDSSGQCIQILSTQLSQRRQDAVDLWWQNSTTKVDAGANRQTDFELRFGSEEEWCSFFEKIGMISSAA